MPIRDLWEDILRIAVTLDAGANRPGQIMRKLIAEMRAARARRSAGAE